MIPFIVGLFVGFTLGVIIMALMNAAAAADRYHEALEERHHGP